MRHTTQDPVLPYFMVGIGIGCEDRDFWLYIDIRFIEFYTPRLHSVSHVLRTYRGLLLVVKYSHRLKLRQTFHGLPGSVPMLNGWSPV